MALRPSGKGWAAQAWAVVDNSTTISGTYSRAGNVVTMTISSGTHGLLADSGLQITIPVSPAPSGSVVANGFYKVNSIISPTQFTVLAANSGSGSGTWTSNVVLKRGYNIASAIREGAFGVRLTFERPFSDSTYACVASAHHPGDSPDLAAYNQWASVNKLSASAAVVAVVDVSNTFQNTRDISAAFFGIQA